MSHGPGLSVAEIYGWGVGRLGLHPTQLHCMGIQTFNAAVDAIVNAEMEREKREWNRARLMACWILSPNVRKGSRLHPRDLGQFPWEEAPVKMDGERILQMLMDETGNQ